MIKFIGNKLARDKSLERLKEDGITAQYRMLSGHELREALQKKLVEEAQEVHDANPNDRQEIIDELADVLEVIDGLCKAYGISMQEVLKEKAARRESRGGFEDGFYLETFEMDENNPKAKYFRKYPHKYPEIE
jgi:predicted house-cleaning noncanonical NTP pyrophosphatase (MazG superfamily)